MKRVFVIHGWEGSPQNEWFPWIKKELKQKGFEVTVPVMPDSNNPRIYNWVPKIAEVVGKADIDTYFIGHSMGCQAIARYLETLPDDIKVGGVVFVAGFFKRLTGLEDDPVVQETDKHWLETPINLDNVGSHINKSVAIFSDDDPFVPLDNQDDFRDKLGSEIVIEHKMSHFNQAAGIKEVPVVLEKLMEIAK
jgi:uncharacterized protein